MFIILFGHIFVKVFKNHLTLHEIGLVQGKVHKTFSVHIYARILLKLKLHAKVISSTAHTYILVYKRTINQSNKITF